jgi:hypothetical protein
MWNKLLNSTVSKSTKWPALHYIYQNPVTGEWVASDNRVMLCELNGAIPMFEFWDTQGNPCDVEGLEYDYERILNEAKERCDSVGHIKYEGRFAFVGDRAVLKEELDKVLKFVGERPMIRWCSGDVNVPIYFQSLDKNLRAVIKPIKSLTSGWRVLDINEDVITTCSTYEEAEMLAEALGIDYLIRCEK